MWDLDTDGIDCKIQECFQISSKIHPFQLSVAFQFSVALHDLQSKSNDWFLYGMQNLAEMG